MMKKHEKEVLQSRLDAEEAEMKHLKAIYNKAAEDITKKIEISNGKISVLLANWDDLTDEEKSVYQSQIYQRNFQQSLKNQIDDFMKDLNSKQYKSITDYMKDCYEKGFIGAMYSIHKQGIPLIMPLDQKKIIKAMFTDSKISKKLYTKLGEDVNLLKKRIANNLSRGIATASSYSDIARNIASASNVGFNKAMRIARTEGARVSNESAFDASKAAKDSGCDVVKMWSAALDKRTRPHHRQLDGQIRELDEPFEVMGASAMYPSDFGIAEEDINCRCALLQRAKWALDDDELKTLEDRAAYYGLDKTKDFDDFKGKYLKAADTVSVGEPKTAKTFTPAKTIKDAEKYAKDKLGFETVKYTGVHVDVANEINKTITDIQSIYPEIKVNRLLANNPARYYAEMDATELQRASGKVTEGTLRLGMPFKGKTLEDIEGVLKKEVDNGWSVGTKSDNVAVTIWHEYGHQYANQLHAQKFISEHPDWVTNDKVYTDYLQECVKDKYYKNVISDAKKAFKKKYGEKMYTSNISGYAGTKDREAFAEAFAEYNCSKNPSRETIEIMKAAGIIKK